MISQTILEKVYKITDSKCFHKVSGKNKPFKMQGFLINLILLFTFTFILSLTFYKYYHSIHAHEDMLRALFESNEVHKSTRTILYGTGIRVLSFPSRAIHYTRGARRLRARCSNLTKEGGNRNEHLLAVLDGVGCVQRPHSALLKLARLLHTAHPGGKGLSARVKSHAPQRLDALRPRFIHDGCRHAPKIKRGAKDSHEMRASARKLAHLDVLHRIHDVTCLSCQCLIERKAQPQVKDTRLPWKFPKVRFLLCLLSELTISLI